MSAANEMRAQLSMEGFVVVISHSFKAGSASRTALEVWAKPVKIPVGSLGDISKVELAVIFQDILGGKPLTTYTARMRPIFSEDPLEQAQALAYQGEKVLEALQALCQGTPGLISRKDAGELKYIVTTLRSIAGGIAARLTEKIEKKLQGLTRSTRV